jgi:hypothetical protein
MKKAKFNKFKSPKVFDFERIDLNRKKKANKPNRKKETEI